MLSLINGHVFSMVEDLDGIEREEKRDDKFRLSFIPLNLLQGTASMLFSHMSWVI